MRRTLAILGSLAVLLMSACGGGGSRRADPPPSTAPTSATTASGSTTTSALPSTTTTVPPDPTVIPPVIDAAYVNSIFKVLDHIYGDAVRTEVSTNFVPPSVVADLRAIYNDPQYQTELRDFSLQLLQGFASSRKPPGDRVTSVLRLITGKPNCIFVQAATDLSAVTLTPEPPAASEFYMLQPKQAGNDPGHLNPTFWAYSYEITFSTPTDVPTKCPAA